MPDSKSPLAKLRALKKAKPRAHPALKPKNKGPAIADFESAIFDGMMGSIDKLGQISSAATGVDVALKEREVVPGVVVSVRTPNDVVDMDAMEAAEDVSKATESAFSRLVFLQMREKQRGVIGPAIKFIGDLAPIDARVKLAREILKLSGWIYVQSKDFWLTPTWMFPSIQMTSDTLDEMFRSEFSHQMTPDYMASMEEKLAEQLSLDEDANQDEVDRLSELAEASKADAFSHIEIVQPSSVDSKPKKSALPVVDLLDLDIL